METFSDLFTARQLVALTTLSDLVAEAREQVKADAMAWGLTDDDVPLRDGGKDAGAYAEAVGVYLAFGIDKAAENSSTICTWANNPNMEVIRGTFGRQALPMTWDYAESNILGNVTGSIGFVIDWLAKAMERLPIFGAGNVHQLDAAARLVPPGALISSDPPYYDNIGYADLSDFFYVWLRRSLRSTYPDIFSTVLVPKAEELVATPYRHGGKAQAETFFMDGMTQAMYNMATQGNPEYPAAIYYAFKQAESDAAGVSSTGWATFLEAVIVAGYSVSGTWPVRSEKAGRMRDVGSNALSSSIILVCRPRPATANITTRTDFLRELRRELPAALKALTASNIAPVDMAQASIGPGMAVYSRYAQVLEADGTRMPVRVALQLINAALDEYFSEQEGHLDEDTRFAVTWFETHGMSEANYGDAETLATARGVSVQGVVEAGLIAARAGRVRLLRRDELPQDWTPGKDHRPTAWEAVQHLTRALEDGGEERAGELMAQLGTLAESARELAYRLYGICERKGWSQDGQAYNALVASWSGAAEAAVRVGTPKGPQQDGLFGEGD
jgi:putative DNA methylase